MNLRWRSNQQTLKYKREGFDPEGVQLLWSYSTTILLPFTNNSRMTNYLDNCHDMYVIDLGVMLKYSIK